jgi:hypothetical protein
MFSKKHSFAYLLEVWFTVLSMEIKLSGSETNDSKKKTNSIKICDVKLAEENCILKETYDTSLCRYPSYVPNPLIKPWIKNHLTEEIIKNPLLEH